jgi:hypothetical protein
VTNFGQLARLEGLESPAYRFEVPGSQGINNLYCVLLNEITRCRVNIYAGLVAVAGFLVSLGVAR